LLNRLDGPVQSHCAESRIVEGFVILNIDEAFFEDVRETVEGNFKHCKTPFLSGLEVDRESDYPD
jgi:hypothetical protein